MAMDEDPEVAARREEFYAAQNHFNLNPTPESKEAYKKASAAFNLALHHAGKTLAPEGKLDTKKPPPTGAAIPAEDMAAIEEARLAQNSAQRAMYANPGPKTREEWKLAKNNYKKVRTQLDPVFRASLSESSRKSQAKKKSSGPA